MFLVTWGPRMTTGEGMWGPWAHLWSYRWMPSSAPQCSQVCHLCLLQAGLGDKRPFGSKVLTAPPTGRGWNKWPSWGTVLNLQPNIPAHSPIPIGLVWELERCFFSYLAKTTVLILFIFQNDQALFYSSFLLFLYPSLLNCQNPSTFVPGIHQRIEEWQDLTTVRKPSYWHHFWFSAVISPWSGLWNSCSYQIS